MLVSTIKKRLVNVRIIPAMGFRMVAGKVIFYFVTAKVVITGK
ncbi:hypothetical protein FLA_5631 [Filimonas lacunae]|nr:hypothetical protein FLA_5631 [Filimonas lacunae]